MTEPSTPDAKRQLSIVPLVAVGTLGVALIAFIVQNTQKTTIEWLFWDGTQPLWAVLLLTSLAAVLLARLGAAVLRRRRD